jgi:hypothetical protein
MIPTSPGLAGTPVRRITRGQARAVGAVALHGNRTAAAESIGVSSHTLRNHCDAVFESLEVQSITGALARLGWLTIPTELLDLEAPPPDEGLVWITGLE